MTTVDSPATTSQRPLFCRELACILVLGALWGVCRFAFAEINDDAMITFVYSRNLARGDGLVFNPGEWVYGTTTPLFGLFVALGIKLGCQPWTWVFAWDVVWGTIILWRLRRILEALGHGDVFWFAAPLILVASPLTLPVAGMETAFYEVFIFSTLDCLVRRAEPWRAMMWGSLAAITRPDGILVAGLAFMLAVAPLLMRLDWKAVVRACSPLLIGVAYAGFVYWLYGTIVPQSMRAKAEVARSLPFDSTFLSSLLTDCMVLYTRIHLLGFASLAGLLVLLRRPRFLPLNLFVFVYAAFFAVGRAPAFLWYRTPLYVLMFVYAALAVSLVIQHLPGRLEKLRLFQGGAPSPRVRRFILGCALALLSAPQLPAYMLIYQRAFSDMTIDTGQKKLREAAAYIREQTPDARFAAAHEIGHLAYFLDGKVVDFEGLVTPEAVRARRSGMDPFLITDAPWFVQAVNYSDPPQWTRDLMERTGRFGYRPVKMLPWDYGMTYVFRRGGS